METTRPTPAASELVAPLWTFACIDTVGIVKKRAPCRAPNPPSCYLVNFKLTFPGQPQSQLQLSRRIIGTVQCNDTIAAGRGNARARMIRDAEGLQVELQLDTLTDCVGIMPDVKATDITRKGHVAPHRDSARGYQRAMARSKVRAALLCEVKIMISVPSLPVRWGSRGRQSDSHFINARRPAAAYVFYRGGSVAERFHGHPGRSECL
jgi:hypothetical protein